MNTIVNHISQRNSLFNIAGQTGVNLSDIPKGQTPRVYNALYKVQQQSNLNPYLGASQLQDMFMSNVLTSKPFRG